MNKFIGMSLAQAFLAMALMIALQSRSQNVMLKVSSTSILAITGGDSAGNIPLPFTESWDQGNFTYHNWTLPAPDNNWSVDTLNGNPPPCADFFWQPHRINYSQVLTSDTIDATAWTCASVWLDFDLKVIAYNTTGNEEMTIEVFCNGSWKPHVELTNLSTTNWTPYHVNIDSVMGQAFRIRFVTHGINSADVLHWYLDNIHVYGNCRGSTSLQGYSGWARSMHLSWQPPYCGPSVGIMTNLIYDDGTWEDGWTSNAGTLGWFGNEFPISPYSSGEIQQVHLYFVDNGTGSAQTLSVDIFDANHVLLGSSAPFIANPVLTWIDVPISNINFYGKFYAMAKFDNLPAQAYYLASDENGPNSAQDLAWNISNTGIWTKASTLGSLPGVFLCRVKALVSGDMNSASDSSILTGYNVYRSGIGGALPYTRRNATILTTTTYIDTLPSNAYWNSLWKYFTTTVFKNTADSTILCEGPSDTIYIQYVGLNDLEPSRIMIYPNPATEQVNVKSDFTITCVEVFNIVGQTVYRADKVGAKDVEIDVGTFDPGVYIFKVSTPEGVRMAKIAVSH